MDDADRYSSLYHALSQGIAFEDKEQKLTDARHRLTLALNSEAIEINQKVAIKANLDKALAREIELKKELEFLFLWVLLLKIKPLSALFLVFSIQFS